jgi:disulfide oxidoreductase YuzD
MYCCPSELSPKISYNIPLFVIEMNNQKNQIEGIGLIKNKYETNKYYKVHTDGNNNRYTYIGKYFIDRETLDDYNSELVYVLDEILFKGYTHSKRGSGLTIFPEKVLKSEVCEGINVKKDIKDIFIYHFREKLMLQKSNEEN